MKIVLIHGQSHKGCSYHIGRMFVEKTEGQNEVTEFFLPRDLPHFCTGCCACIEDDTACPCYTEKSKITDAIEEADLLVFTTPTYCMRASSGMKSLIELTFTYWMSHRPREIMFHKKAVVISTAAGAGANLACKDVKTALFYMGVPKVSTYGIAAQATGWDSITQKKKEKIEKDMTKLARKIESSKPPKAGIKTRFMFFVMGMMQKMGFGSSPVEKDYWEKNGWFDKKRPWKTQKQV